MSTQKYKVSPALFSCGPQPLGAFLYTIWQQQSSFARPCTPPSHTTGDEHHCSTLPPVEAMFSSLAQDAFLEVRRRTPQQLQHEVEDMDSTLSESGAGSSFEVVLLVTPLLMMYHRHTAAKVELRAKGAAAAADAAEAEEETAARAEEVVAEAAPADAIAGVALPATATWGAKKKVDGLAMQGGCSSIGKGAESADMWQATTLETF